MKAAVNVTHKRQVEYMFYNCRECGAMLEEGRRSLGFCRECRPGSSGVPDEVVEAWRREIALGAMVREIAEREGVSPQHVYTLVGSVMKIREEGIPRESV